MVNSLAYFKIKLKYTFLNVCEYCEVYYNKDISTSVILREMNDEILRVF